MGERISDEVIAHCHQCGAPCDSHTNCKNDGCHLLFIQCPQCASKFNGCCSEQCCEELALPEEEQRRRRATSCGSRERQHRRRAGRENGNKIFNKSRGRLNSKLSIPDPAE
ncbi:Rhodanese-related sulfurtransferase [Salmonella enterica subsp. enterica serovar Give str. S5-487]|nr:Rhodanese-related sulfurtransferase [Salmonella enterica subsp. enterica serovar Give str. S5-487]